MPRILQAIACGGTRDAIDEVALHHGLGLREAGAEVTTLARLPAPRMEAHRATGATVLHEPRLDTTLAALDPLALARTARRIRQARPDAILVHTGKAYPLLRLLAPRGVPLISVCHGPGFKLRLGADIILCLNGAQMEAVRAALGARAAQKRILVLPNPSVLPDGASAGEPGARLAGWRTKGEVVLGFLGQIRAVKGVDVLLEAVTMLAREGLPLRLVLGGAGPERAAMEALAERLGIAPRVRFLGWVEDRVAFFAGIDLFACPSREEPFGMVAAQAMELGVPVIASDAPGFAAQITPDETGWLAARGDAASLAACLREAMDRPEKARRMAEAARDVVTARGDRVAVARRILDEVTAWKAAR